MGPFSTNTSCIHFLTNRSVKEWKKRTRKFPLLSDESLLDTSFRELESRPKGIDSY